jgi:hypothetical protein
MTRSVLQEQRDVKVWRLDGGTGNTAEFLNVDCDGSPPKLLRF